MSDPGRIEIADDASAPVGPLGITISAAASGTAPVIGASAAVAAGLSTPGDGAPTLPVASMLKYVIEGYLLGDLESMATEIRLKEFGAVGYPMVMAVLSGSELLGALTTDVSEDNRIETYWKTYLAQVDPKYGDLGKIASALARNGIAHSYLSHQGVMVVRGDPGRHLSLYGGEVIFDCLELYAHFRQSYDLHARSWILEHVPDAQRRIDALVRHDKVRAQSLISKLPAERFPETLVPLATATTTSAGGVSISLATPIHIRRPKTQ